MRDLILVISAFLASAVEMVEALTIVLAVGITRGWRSALIGVVAAMLALAAIVALLGPTLQLIPIDTLRLVVGFLLLAFGMQWLRKAILRAAGYKPLHDEDAAFRSGVEEARAAAPAGAHGTGTRMDWFAFTLSFKGVFLEGLEIVFIVLTIGTSQGNVALASVGAAGAVLIVGAVGVAVRTPLSRVPENAMKFGVGVMLTTFGIFWGSEGAGVRWPGSDAAILVVLGVVLLVALGFTAVLRRRRAATTHAHVHAPAGSAP